MGGKLGRIKLHCSSLRKWSDQTAARARGGALHGKIYDFVKGCAGVVEVLIKRFSAVFEDF
jgi:hypothetical protein